MRIPKAIATPLERITWRDGQMLASSDLRDDRANQDRLRHLHIRYLHGTWGVVEGLGVIALGASGVVVTAGYALDADGRELLVPGFLRVPAPANVIASTTMYLVLSYASASASTPELSMLCPGVKTATPIEQGQISWKPVNEVQPGSDVMLARVLISGGAIASAADTSIQRRAATMIQPRMWSDVTQQGQTGWADVVDGNIREILAIVDTSEGGFTSTPAYFAQLSGTTQAAAGFVSSSSTTGFTFVVRPLDTVNAAKAESDGWAIAWFGVELLKG